MQNCTEHWSDEEGNMKPFFLLSDERILQIIRENIGVENIDEYPTIASEVKRRDLLP